MLRKNRLCSTVLMVAVGLFVAHGLHAQDASKIFPAGTRFQWQCSEPLIPVRDVPGIHCYSIKDPSVVRFQDRWYLFATIRGQERTHATVVLNFDQWSQAKDAQWQVLPMHPGYFCAPQVFYYTPHQRWYFICQASNSQWGQKYGPAFATCERIDQPSGWSELRPMFDAKPQNLKGWIDFWVICDSEKAHLFFTSNDGRMWRCETSHAQFPLGWSTPAVVLEDDIFEASHIYRIGHRDADRPAPPESSSSSPKSSSSDALDGSAQYLAVVEAQHGAGFRYYKAYTAERLDAAWRPLVATKQSTFASMLNVIHPAKRWTDAISHGELVRRGVDERMEIDPDHLQFVFQGVLETDRAGKPYGEIPWQIGMLQATAP